MIIAPQQGELKTVLKETKNECNPRQDQLPARVLHFRSYWLFLLILPKCIALCVALFENYPNLGDCDRLSNTFDQLPQ